MQHKQAAPKTLFYSYAHEDEALQLRLETHLSLLHRQGLISQWHDRQIIAGTVWKQEIDEHLEAASIILLLISPDFLASDYCYSIEMQRALQRHQNDEAQVIPIILRPVDWEGAPFSHLQCLPRDARAITEWDNQDAAFRDIAKGIRAAIDLLLELTRDLLDRAQINENAPIPVVFNLSSWAKKRFALSDWLVEELSIRYEVPRRLGQSWVNEDRLLLLLDGLDEVASASRKECIAAINNYRQTHPDVQIVVCSRHTEYLNEPIQLRLHTAVVVQPLTQEQIAIYLESAGEQAESLREALRQDADLRELAFSSVFSLLLQYIHLPSFLLLVSLLEDSWGACSVKPRGEGNQSLQQRTISNVVFLLEGQLP